MTRSIITADGVWVLVATYQRPAQLARLLESLAQVQMPDDSAMRKPQLMVVDNAPEPEVQETVHQLYPEVHYIHQPAPGIATARNTAIEALPQDAQAVIFVDDDEYVEPGWFSALLHCANETGADGIAGPVFPDFTDGQPQWVDNYGYVRSTDRATGPGPLRLATNNTLVRAEWFTRLGFRFDEAFDFTGGEDSDLFDRLREAGTTYWWCAAARVHETVPPQRATKKWLRSRALRGGRVRVLKRRRRGGNTSLLTLRLGCEGVARIVYGSLRRTAARARSRPITYTDDYYICEGLGMLQSLIGRGGDEYRR